MRLVSRFVDKVRSIAAAILWSVQRLLHYIGWHSFVYVRTTERTTVDDVPVTVRGYDCAFCTYAKATYHVEYGSWFYYRRDGDVTTIGLPFGR